METLRNRRRRESAFRGMVATVIWLFLATPGRADNGPFSSSQGARVRHEAEQRARQPFRPPPDELPQALRELDYDGYRTISYRPDRALWADENLPFQVEFFHRGYLFPKRVRVFILDGAQAHEAPFSSKLFDYSASAIRPAALPEDLGFTGFRLLYPIHQADHHHEFISFLGASYFRALGAHQVYGTSARGLAVGMGAPVEEFPYFEAFWIEQPSAGARAITVYALLDSASVTGAYRFDVRPGEATLVDVHAELFARTTFSDVGVAPLTSMYFYGRNGPKQFQDSRPQVHDSDGLLIAHGSGEWIWRPLWNPLTISLSTFEAESVKGFGLLQRARDPCDYEDKRTSYERRPSIWVEPLTPWQGGAVRLLELPSNGEGQDNIGACWVRPAGAGAPPGAPALSLAYRLTFGKAVPEPSDVGRVVATHWSGSAEAGTRFEVDFDLGPARLDPRGTPAAAVSATGGQVSAVHTQRAPSSRYWRVTFEAAPDPNQIMEIRASLRRDGRTLTEVWSFPWPR